MAETPTPEVRPNESAGHLSVHVEGAHPVEIPYLFQQHQKRIPSALAGSLVRAQPALVWTSTDSSLVVAPLRVLDAGTLYTVGVSQLDPAAAVAAAQPDERPPRQAEMPGRTRLRFRVEATEDGAGGQKEPDPVLS
jgi:hypothetical protein